MYSMNCRTSFSPMEPTFVRRPVCLEPIPKHPKDLVVPVNRPGGLALGAVVYLEMLNQDW